MKKELYTGEGCVEMDILWQICRTIGPLLSQRFALASAKAQPMGDFLIKLPQKAPGTSELGEILNTVEEAQL